MSKRIFVTGASGFIGSNLVKKLVEQGRKVTVFLRKDSYHPFLRDLKIKKVYGDVTNLNSIVKGMKDCNYVYHLAAFISYNKADRSMIYDVNVLGTKNVMNAALKLKIKKVVHVSACAAIGYSENPVDENFKFPGKFNKVAYIYTKHLAEKKVIGAYKRGLKAVIVNPCTVFGQGDQKLNSGAVIKSIKNKKIFVAPPGGTSVVSVDDVIEGIILAMKKGKPGERYILSNEKIPYIKLFNIIAKELRTNRIKWQLPAYSYYILLPLVWLLEKIFSIFNKKIKLTSQVINFSFKFRYFDSTKARKELDWKPKVNINEVIRKAIEFYKKEGLM